MKRLTLTAALIALLPAFANAGTPASAPLAQPAVAAGYTGPGSAPQLRTLAQAQQAADDARFVLEGHVVRKLGDERYEFVDASGKGEVEIDDKHLPATSFDQQHQVRLSGKVDKEWYGKRELEVKRVELLD